MTRSELQAACAAIAPDAFPEDDEFPEDFPVMVNTNDWFMWGCADGEIVAESDLPDIRRAVAEAGQSWGPLLWASRKNGRRPQGAWFEHIPSELHSLFLATGAPIPIGFGNPYPAPDQTVPGNQEGMENGK